MRIIILFVCLFVTFPLYALTADEVVEKILSERKKIQTWSAMYVQKTSGGILGQDRVEMGRIVVKGDKTRKDIQRPERRVVVQTPDQIFIKNEETGMLETQDLTASQSGMPRMTPEEALRQVSFQIQNESDKEIVLVGMLGEIQMEFVIALPHYLPIKMTSRLPQNMVMTISQSYTQVGEVLILEKSVSDMSFQMQDKEQRMQVEQTYRNIKVNEPVSDEVFGL